MISASQRRVVVTGLGAITNVGIDVPTMWRSLIEGRSGIDRISAFEQDDQWTVKIAGEIRDFEPDRVIDQREAKRMDRFCLFGLGAAVQAAEDSGFDFSVGDPYRRGVVIGSGIGGILTIEVGHEKLLRTSPRKISPFIVPKLMVNACAGNVSIRYNLRGSNSATATACATGAHAIGTAFHLIQRGDADLMFAGGSEAAITPLCIGSFAAMKALSTRNDDPPRASRPFDSDRDGFVLSEGSGVVILENLEHARKRGAKIYAEVIGFGSSGDAAHIAAPDPEGLGARASMEFAVRDAGVNLDEVDYINAHGTATPLGDDAEVLAVKGLFGEHATKLAMSSTKSMTGHALGAAGGIESVITILAVKEDVLPPTINLDEPSNAPELNYVAHEAQPRVANCVLNNSFGFGGHNVTLVFRKYRGD
ncbi:MAG: beta-ketoacyl-ACP synthase II [Planctomycetota bacterium]|nr:beta-ketoacyl-ACP synthase II [Planctomycetota bacterium]